MLRLNSIITILSMAFLVNCGHNFPNQAIESATDDSVEDEISLTAEESGLEQEITEMTEVTQNIQERTEEFSLSSATAVEKADVRTKYHVHAMLRGTLMSGDDTGAYRSTTRVLNVPFIASRHVTTAENSGSTSTTSYKVHIVNYKQPSAYHDLQYGIESILRLKGDSDSRYNIVGRDKTAAQKKVDGNTAGSALSYHLQVRTPENPEGYSVKMETAQDIEDKFCNSSRAESVQACDRLMAAKNSGTVAVIIKKIVLQGHWTRVNSSDE